ncbi:alcohol dehydrogenase [Atractiella rhizophila]|nr:alcohol dehydrogenase [Atractiella rhizophila]
MGPISNPRLYLKASVEEGEYPIPGQHLAHDASEEIDPEVISLSGGILVKVLCVAIDPYLRGRMRNGGESYIDPFVVGENIVGSLVGEILRSESNKFQPGQLISAFAGFQQYLILDANDVSINPLPALPVPHATWLGVLGAPGLTAFAAWKEYSHAKQGEKVFITTGAGAVGSVIIQLAKLDGCRVIASGGSDEKLQFMRECGADVSFNYKKASTEEALKEFGGIDIYLDAVSGAQTDAALANMRPHGRIIVSGAASEYSDHPKGIKNWSQIMHKRLTVHGFTILELMPKYLQDFYATFPAKVLSGEIKHRQTTYHGLDKGPQALDDVLRGRNEGKVVVVL